VESTGMEKKDKKLEEKKITGMEKKDKSWKKRKKQEWRRKTKVRRTDRQTFKGLNRKYAQKDTRPGLPDGTHIFIPKIPIWVYFGGPWNWKRLVYFYRNLDYLTFGLGYGHFKILS
jgi:hypothetical protein